MNTSEWNAETVRLTLNVARASAEVKQAIDLLQIQTQTLSDHAEKARLETRTDVDKWLEETLTVLYTSDRTDCGIVDGYEHCHIGNDRINRQHETWSQDELNRSLDEVEQAFVNTVLSVLQENVGKKILVRLAPTYRMSEEGHHFIRCRLQIEKVN